MKYKTIYLSRIRAESLGGYALNCGDHLETMAPSDFIPEGRCIYIFDEFTSADSDTFAATLSVIDDERRIGQHRYPAMYAIALCNPPEQAANGNEIPLPVLNRLLIHEHTHLDEFFSWVSGEQTTGELERIWTLGLQLNIPVLVVGAPGTGKTKRAQAWAESLPDDMPVSYTHLTLPTNREV